MFVISPDVRADNARAALALPGSRTTSARGRGTVLHNLVVPAGPRWLPMSAGDPRSGREERRPVSPVRRRSCAGRARPISNTGSAMRSSISMRQDDSERPKTPHPAGALFPLRPLAALDRFDEATAVAGRGHRRRTTRPAELGAASFEIWRGLQALQAGRSPMGRRARGPVRAQRCAAGRRIIDAAGVGALGV